MNKKITGISLNLFTFLMASCSNFYFGTQSDPLGKSSTNSLINETNADNTSETISKESILDTSISDGGDQFLTEMLYGKESDPYLSFHSQGFLVFDNIVFTNNSSVFLLELENVWGEDAIEMPIFEPSFPSFDNVLGLDLFDGLISKVGIPSFLGTESSYSLDYIQTDGTIKRIFFEKPLNPNQRWRRHIVTKTETIGMDYYLQNEIVDWSKTASTYSSRADYFKTIRGPVCLSDALKILGKANRKIGSELVFEWDVNDGTTIRGNLSLTDNTCGHGHSIFDGDFNYMIQNYEVVSQN